MEWTLKEYKTNQRKYPHLTEYVGMVDENAAIVPFVDFDMGWKSEDELPTKETQHEIFERVIDTFQSLFLNTIYNIIAAHRRMGFASKLEKNKETGKYDVETGKYKISLRLWIRGLTSTRKIMETKLTGYLPDMSKFPDIMKNSNWGTSVFDVSVYNKDRKMCCLNKTKSREDPRVLERWYCDDVPLEDYLIQNVHNTDEEAKWTITDHKNAKGKQVKTKDGKTTMHIENAAEKIIFDTVLKCFADAYVRRDLSRPTAYENCMITLAKNDNCLIATADHKSSTHKMYFIVGKSNVKYKCTECEQEMVYEPESTDVKKLFSPAPPTKDEEFSLENVRLCLVEGEENKLMEYFNEYFGKVTDKNTVWYCNRKTPSRPWMWRKKQSFLEATEHLNFFVQAGNDDDEDGGAKSKKKHNNKKYNVGKFWSEHPKMRTFNKIVFDPSHVGDFDNNLNMFRGFKARMVPKYDLKKIQPILDHIKLVLNGGNEDDYLYNIKWLAHIVQRPHIKTGTAPVIFGEQGAGKNTIYEFFGEMVIGAEHYIYINDTEDLTGHFTGILSCAIFSINDEVYFSGGHKVHSKLKSLITQRRQKLEKKGVDAVQVLNYNNNIFISNQSDPVKIEDGDRRYWVNKVSDCKVRITEYFDRLYACLEDPETPDHFFTYLMEQDVSDFRVGQAPDTGEKEVMKEYAKTSMERFVDDLIDGNVECKGRQDHEGAQEYHEPEYFSPGETYETTMVYLYGVFKKPYNPDKNLTTKLFGRSLRRMVNITNKTEHRHGGTPVSLTVRRM